MMKNLHEGFLPSLFPLAASCISSPSAFVAKQSAHSVTVSAGEGPSREFWPKFIFAKRDKHYPSRSRQTSLAAVPKFTKPVTKNYFGPRTS